MRPQWEEGRRVSKRKVERVVSKEIIKGK